MVAAMWWKTAAPSSLAQTKRLQLSSVTNFVSMKLTEPCLLLKSRNSSQCVMWPRWHNAWKWCAASPAKLMVMWWNSAQMVGWCRCNLLSCSLAWKPTAPSCFATTRLQRSDARTAQLSNRPQIWKHSTKRHSWTLWPSPKQLVGLPHLNFWSKA